MNNDILSDALRRRKGRKFDAKGFMDADKPKAGLDSEDILEKETVVMGKGVKQEVLDEGVPSKNSSTDELAPSRREMAARNVDGAEEPKPKRKMRKPFEEEDEELSEVGGGVDEDVFDEGEYDKISARGPKSIYERMQMALGKKLRG